MSIVFLIVGLVVGYIYGNPNYTFASAWTWVKSWVGK